MDQEIIIKNLIKFAQTNSEIEVLWLYGSRAKGNARAESDYDLAIAFNTAPKDVLERRLRPELLAMDWVLEIGLTTKDLSIIDINLVPIPLAWEVISTGKVLFVKNSLRLVREELRISSAYELDILYHRRRYAA